MAWLTRASGLVAILSNIATSSRPPMRWCRSSMLLRNESTAVSSRSTSSYTCCPSGVSAKPDRPRRHSTTPSRTSRSFMWRLTVEVPMFSSSSAAAMPPQSATLLNTFSRRRSMSLSWPGEGRILAGSFTCMAC